MTLQEEFPELNPLVERKFEAAGDIDRAVELVHKSDGLTRTKQLAIAHAEAACRHILKLAPSRERNALVELARIVVQRSF